MEEKIPKHVAIILDGNGRWATKRGLKRSEGHKAGFENLKKLTKHIMTTGVEILSIYAFSTENFKRDKEEVDYLMNLFIHGFKSSIKEFNSYGVKVIFSGGREPLSNLVWESMKELENSTKDNTKGILNICLNYGGRKEIVDTTKKLIEKVINKEINIEDINEEVFRKNLYNDLPPIDLLIRTSGEYRISNFMLYNLAYSEMYFTDTLFPDFNSEEFDKALYDYSKRDRRFGGNKKQ